MYKSGLDFRKRPSKLYKSSMNERLVLSLTRGCPCHMYKKYLMLASTLLEDVACCQPVWNECCFTTTFIACYDKRLVLNLNLVLLIFLSVLILAIILSYVGVAFTSGHIYLNEVVQILQVTFVSMEPPSDRVNKLKLTRSYTHSCSHHERSYCL